MAINKILIVILSFCFLHPAVKADVKISLMTSRLTAVNIERDLRINISNTNGTVLKVKLQGWISDANGTTLATLESSYFDLKANNTRQALLSQLDGFKYSFQNQEAGNYYQAKNYLTPKATKICIRLIPFESSSPIGEACIPLVNTIKPPVLVSPSNGATTYDLNPVLTWLPMVSFGGGGTKSYQVKLTKIESSQSAFTALTSNIKYLDINDYSRSSLQYRNTNFPLEYGKKYAWQICGYSDDILIGCSEIWTFSPDTIKHTPLPPSHVIYYEGKPDNSHKYISVGKCFYLKYNSSTSRADLSLFLYDRKNTQLNETPLKLNVKYGDNRFTIHPESLSDDFEYGKEYTLQIRSSETSSPSYLNIQFNKE